MTTSATNKVYRDEHNWLLGQQVLSQAWVHHKLCTQNHQYKLH